MDLLRTATLLSLATCLHAADTIIPTRFPGTTWDDTNWRITTTSLSQGHYEARMSLANGYLGINLAALGPFFEVDTPVNGDLINGWPLFDRRQTFATIAGFYDRQTRTNGSNFDWLYQYDTGESVIAGVPHWGGLHVVVGGEVLGAGTDAREISNFSSTLDLKAGTMGWRYAWSPGNGSAIGVEYTMLVHKLYVNRAAVQLKLTAGKDVNVSVVDVLQGDCALRTTEIEKYYDAVAPIIGSGVSPNGEPGVEGYIFSLLEGDDSCDTGSRSQYNDSSIIGGNASSIAQAMTVSLKGGRTSTITKYIGGASSDAFDDPKAVALLAVVEAQNEGFHCMLESHTCEWNSILTADSVDDYRLPNGSLPENEEIRELQITAYTNSFHLLQNTIGSNAILAANNNTMLDVNSIAVGGLGSESYAGWIFWDAEVWMAPGLAVAHPQAAKQIARYRVEKFPQAQANIQTAFMGTLNQTDRFSPNGAVYPWVSGRPGNCTGAGPCWDYEYHINGDIGLEFLNYYVVTGDSDFFRTQLLPIYDAIAQFFTDVVTYNATLDAYELLNATDPDEYANFERDVGYTMVLMKTHVETANSLRARFGMEQNSTWATVAKKMYVPVYEPANIIREYATMNNTVQVKQADIVLIDDFLEYPNGQALNDLDYYAAKQSLNGPGMTYGVFSVIANALSPSGCASYTYDIAGSQPYIRGPWFQFSEQLVDNFNDNGGTHPAYPFLTGIGGANRVAVFGFLGLKLELDALNVNPSLPPQIETLRYRTIYWQGWPISAYSNQSHTTLTRTGSALENANSTFSSSPIPVTIGLAGESQFGNTTVYQLAPNSTLTLLNRRIGDIKTLPGNLAQCQPVSSKQTYQPGQFPFAANDGSVSTKWQPTQANISSSITVALAGSFVPVTAIYFNWAQAPPHSYNVSFSNSSDGSGAVLVASSTSVAISDPYVAATAYEIVLGQSNSTNVSLGTPVWSGRFAVLSIMGSAANDGTVDALNGTGATVAEFAVVAGS
ncbi:hypothetical protein LTR62_007570 [Meristemomyces frigidus]|uniref:alpha,alpha-trehalase n=1 Tax=Meristemomyces frigidus TaxID=1508187 RepID=A0AAN7TBF8_9PEZI|nr:hypothetical protein LTR62_007570 [Meristemomyces frigidus]